MRYNRILFAVILLAVAFIASGQHYIKPINSEGFFVDEIISQRGDIIVYEMDDVEFDIPKSEVKLIEYLEGGVVIYNKDAVKVIDTSSITVDSLYNKGNNVYIPFSSTKIVSRSGSRKLRELVAESEFWNMVDCKEEAHFVLEYVYDDDGRDRAYLVFKTQEGEIFFETKSVGASDWIPSHAGEDSAEELYKKKIKKFFKNGVLQR